MIITISGKSCSGKSSLAEYLCSRIKNAKHLSIDEVGHRVIEEDDVKAKICQAFNIPYEKYSRKAIAKEVFNDSKKMNILTQITWEKMQKIIDAFIEENRGFVIILDWILMPKSKYFEMSDINFLVDVPQDVRLERAVKRDGISKEKFLERDSAAIDYKDYRFDFVISNIDLEEAKNEIWRYIKKQDLELE